MQSYLGKLVLISGGSSGIGFAVGKKLAHQGANVWILARNPDRLGKALKEIQALRLNESQQFGCLQAHVQDADEVSRVLSDFEKNVGVPDYLINSAGIAHPGYFEDLPAEIFQRQITVNYLGTVFTTQAVIHGMIRRGSGTIVNISSIAGFMGLFGYSAYGPSKYAVRGFSDCIRAELKSKGIKVCLVYPPDTDTPQLAYENQFKPLETAIFDGNAKTMTADDVASAIIKGIARGQYSILPGFEGKALYRLIGILGDGISNWLIDLMVSDAVKKARQRRNGLQR